MATLAFVGGTGAEGFGLALRFAAAGDRVRIGSRTVERAAATAARLRSTLPGARATGHTNGDAVEAADGIFLTVPFAGLDAAVGTVAERLAGRLLIDPIVPLVVQNGFFALAPVPGAASVGEWLQQRLPGTRVVSGFKNLAADELANLDTDLQGDIVLCGEDRTARAEVAAMVGRLPGLRAVDAGGIANARYVEAITGLLVNLNRRRKVRTSIRILGIG
jgi:8-hydroxy-5-deazaflavin:NADPH oxidoreductase